MTRRKGYTRLSKKNQVTIPVAVLERAGLRPGTELKVDVAENGTIVLEPARPLAERRREAIEKYAGIFKGVYPPNYLEDLRNEWER